MEVYLEFPSNPHSSSPFSSPPFWSTPVPSLARLLCRCSSTSYCCWCRSLVSPFCQQRHRSCFCQVSVVLHIRLHTNSASCRFGCSFVGPACPQFLMRQWRIRFRVTTSMWPRYKSDHRIPCRPVPSFALMNAWLFYLLLSLPATWLHSPTGYIAI